LAEAHGQMMKMRITGIIMMMMGKKIKNHSGLKDI